MSSYKIYNLNQSGGAPKKKLQSPKKVKGVAKIKGLAGPAGPTTNPLTTLVEEQVMQIKTLQEELKVSHEQFNKCGTDSIQALETAKVQATLDKTTQLDALRAQLQQSCDTTVQQKVTEANTQSTLDKTTQLNALRAQLQQSCDTTVQQKVSEAKTQLQQSCDATVQQKVSEANTQSTLDKTTQLNALRTQLMQDTQAKISAAQVQVTASIISDALAEYTANKNKFAKVQLSKLCPKDSTDAVCKNVISIPDIYIKDPQYNITIGACRDKYSPGRNNYLYYEKPGFTAEQCNVECNNNSKCFGFMVPTGGNYCWILTDKQGDVAGNPSEGAYKCYLKQ